MKVTKSLNASSHSTIHTYYAKSTPVKVISPGEVCKRHLKTYRIHTTHSDLLSRIVYVRLQGHKESNTNIIYKSYDNDMAYTLDLLNSEEALDIQTTYVD